MERRAGFVLALLITGSQALHAQGTSVSVSPPIARQRSTIVEQVEAGATGVDWPSHGGELSAWRYSSLDQINRGNIDKLLPAWIFQTGDYQDGITSTPIVVDGVLYLTSANGYVFALDGATGTLIWQYKFQPPTGTARGGSYFKNRGVAVGGGKVFVAAADDYLVALDQKSGHEVWRVAGSDASSCRCSTFAAPLIVKDKVVVSGSAPRGKITAFNMETGHLEWRFYTVPGAGESGNETWEGKDSWKYGGNVPWATGSFDPDLNLVYWGGGDPKPPFFDANRGGANLYASSILALDADTGKLRWYYQMVPHDDWDFDASSEMMLLNREVDGKIRKLLVHFNKSGFAFVLDRQTGEFIKAYPFIDNYNWVTGIGKKGELLERNDPKYGIGKNSFICPSNVGAKSWNQGAYSPRTGWVYSPALEMCNDLVIRGPSGTAGDRGGGTWVMKPPQGHDTGYSHLDAYDPVTGNKQWTYPYKFELLASILATAGDLVLTGDAEGFFFALDARTGHKLWQFQTGASNRGSPITYMARGRQYVAVPTGRSSPLSNISMVYWPEAMTWRVGSTLLVFAIPQATK